MPYMSYQVSIEEAIRNAGRFMAECGCDAVKLEGGREMLDVVRAIVRATIPVVGHLGLTPQSIAMLGGFKAQGRDASTALRIIEDAKALEEAGICLLLGLGLRFVAPAAILVIASLIAGTSGNLYWAETDVNRCGCLPGLEWQLGAGHLVTQVAMLTMATQIWLHKGELLSLDGKLFGRSEELATSQDEN